MGLINKLTQLFCSHVNKTEVLEQGEIVYTMLPKHQYDECRNYYIDVVKTTCYKCNKVEIKYKKRWVSSEIYTL